MLIGNNGLPGLVGEAGDRGSPGPQGFNLTVLKLYLIEELSCFKLIFSTF